MTGNWSGYHLKHKKVARSTGIDVDFVVKTRDAPRLALPRNVKPFHCLTYCM